MSKDSVEYKYTFPYLYDETQDVAKAYKAMCTPEFYCFDSELKLVYHGQFDDARAPWPLSYLLFHRLEHSSMDYFFCAGPGKNVPVTGRDIRDALDAIIAGKSPAPAKPSIGCNVKWHPGNEPDYFR
jgi:hypothetical protein